MCRVVKLFSVSACENRTIINTVLIGEEKVFVIVFGMCVVGGDVR